MHLNDRGLSFELRAYGAFIDGVRLLRGNELEAGGKYRDGEASLAQHRHKVRQEFDDEEIYALSADIPVSAARLRLFIDDCGGIEQLSHGRFNALCDLRLGYEIQPAGSRTRFAAALRRPAEQVACRRLGRRLWRRERLGVREALAFESICQSEEIRRVFLEMLRGWPDTDQVPGKLKEKIARHAIATVENEMDELDRKAFGTLTPYWPSAFNQIVGFWNRAGVAYLAAREVLTELAACEVADFFAAS